MGNSNKMIGYEDKMISKDEPWRIFHIMSEFVNGFETMAEIGPAVSVFGSARIDSSNSYYKLGVKTGRLLVKAGFAVITGGGPGIMEAVNKGAIKEGGKSVGLSIVLPNEQKSNRFLNLNLTFRYFFCRKVMFLRYAKGFIFLPGGYGTMDELFESLTLIQNNREKNFPVVLVGRRYWRGLNDWLKKDVLGEKCITGKDMSIINVVDTPEEAVDFIIKGKKK